MKNWNIDFFSQEDFKRHVTNTLACYLVAMQTKETFDKFNENIVDPIKLTFDMKAFGKTFNEVVEDEIGRQNDKSVTNAIGYFHQNLFKLIKNCEVPKQGFDVIYTRNDSTKVYVELKNKHNTMNAASSRNTYQKMQQQLKTNPNCVCYLVEVIATKSQNIPWKIKGLDESNRIRRVSIDRFYEEITGDSNAFRKICDALPNTIDEITKDWSKSSEKSSDPVIKELKHIDEDPLKALYKTTFKTYKGFEK